MVGGAAPGDRAGEPAPSDGQRRTSRLSGELFVGVGMPRTSTSGEVRAGWELVAGATAAPPPRERAHHLDPALAAPERGVRGGYLQINGVVGSKAATLAASLALRAAEIPFAWDYGDCAGGPGCPVWNQKGAPATAEDLAWGAGGSLMLWCRVAPRWGVVFGAAFDVPPSIATSQRGGVACDANGNCTGGRRPSTPEAGAGELHRQLVVGADVRPTRWSRAFLLLVHATPIDAEAGYPHARAGLEASF